jgi:hypothetical protein
VEGFILQLFSLSALSVQPPPNSTLSPLRDTPSTIREFPVFLSGCISVSFFRFDPLIPAIGHISHFYPTKSLSGVTIHNRQHAAQEGRCA